MPAKSEKPVRVLTDDELARLIKTCQVPRVGPAHSTGASSTAAATRCWCVCSPTAGCACPS
ncbi:hypothetical protein NKG94_23955 [Micromonospora sp. M12]